MNKLKDLIYNVNDIIVAFVILLVVGLIINVSIHNIMEYPETLAKEQQLAQEKNKPKKTDNNQDNQMTNVANQDNSSNNENNETNTNSENNTQQNNNSNGSSNSENNTNKPTGFCSVYIEYGESIDSIAEKFVTVKLFENKQQFKDMVKYKNVAEKLRAGNFVLSVNATPEEVMDTITGGYSN